MASIDELTAGGYSHWFDREVAKSPTLLQPAIEGAEKNWQVANNTQRGQIVGITDVSGFSSAWWANIPQGSDQLRQRVALALSELFVVSMQDNRLKYEGPAVANFYDTLVRDAFGNYRQLLEDVTLHPVMGNYLTWVNNKKETYDATGVIVHTPDENYAREVMQLFSIGLNQLNPDGSPKVDSNGQPIPTYSHNDVAGLAKVLTGWTTDPTATAPLWATAGTNGVPMVPLQPSVHSTAEKQFLGVTIAATSAASSASMRAELKVMLDALFNHPNCGPFIARQLIQRLVTSNPSAGYVTRVGAVFNDNGNHVRGDMQAVIKAVLMDRDAHDEAKLTDPQFGKVREPILRFTNWLRAFNAKGAGIPALSGIGSTSDPAGSLAQSPMNASSVFNFFRPGYAPANSVVGNAGLVGPELQITDEQSVIGYQNFMASAIPANSGLTSGVTFDTSAELALVDDVNVDALLDRLNLELMEGYLPTAVRADVRAAVLSVTLQNPGGTSKGDQERHRRLWSAIYLLMASPEYVVQR